jgi:hypothetical protein
MKVFSLFIFSKKNRELILNALIQLKKVLMFYEE